MKPNSKGSYNGIKTVGGPNGEGKATVKELWNNKEKTIANLNKGVDIFQPEMRLMFALNIILPSFVI